MRRYHAAVWDEPLVMELGRAGRRGVVFDDIEPEVKDVVGDASELVAQFFPRQLFVVHDHHAKLVHAVISSSTISSGTSMRAMVPLPGSLVNVSWYVAP